MSRVASSFWVAVEVVTALAVVPCRSQGTLTLEQCLARASENNPQLRIAENAVRSAELSLSELKTTSLPQLRGAVTATYVPVPPTFGYDPAVTDGGQISGQVVLRQSLYDGGVRGLKGDQLQSDVNRLGQEHRLARLDLILLVKQTFIEGLRAQDEVELQQLGVEQLESYHELVLRLFKGGTASSTDLLKTEMQTSTSRLALEKAREAMAAAKLALAELMGVPPDTSLRLAGSLAAAGVQDSLVKAGEADVASTLEMNIAGLLVQKSLFDYELADRERLPEISLLADAGYLSSGDNLRLPKNERLNGLGYSVGIGIDFPILNWGATNLRMQQRQLATDDLRQRTEILRRSLNTELRRSRMLLQNALARLKTLHENVTKAEENFLLTKSKYAVGGTLALEVLTAHQLLADSRLAELQTLADIQVLTARIERETAHE